MTIRLTELLLQEYNTDKINKLLKKWRDVEGNATYFEDVKNKAEHFDRIKGALKRTIETAKAQATAELPIEDILTYVPTKFLKGKTQRVKNPETGAPMLKVVSKPRDYMNIDEYEYRELEAILDQFPSKTKEKKSRETNTAKLPEDDADLIYNSGGVEVYQADTKDKCIRFNNDMGVEYKFCIGRKGVHANYYYSYRFGRGTVSRAFYFVFNRNQSSELGADGKFKNWYHVFVIHVGSDEKSYGVTDVINEHGPHEVWGVSWEQVGNFMVEHGGESGRQSWNAIKNLKSLFKYVEPPEDESVFAAMRGMEMPPQAFQALSYEHKIMYIQNKAPLPLELTRLLDKELLNLAINSDYEFSFNELKQSEGLLKSYAKRRHDFHRNELLPLPFIPFLRPEDRQEYYEKVKNDYTSFSEILKYFGEDTAQEYLQEEIDELGYLPEEAEKYMTPEQKRKFDSYKLLYKNITTEEVDQGDLRKPKVLKAKINSLRYEQYIDLSTEERKQYFDAVNTLFRSLNEGDVGRKRLKQAILSTAPELIQINGKYYLFIKKDAGNQRGGFVLCDINGRIVVDGIDSLELKKNGKDILGNKGVPQKYTGTTTWQVPESDYDEIYIYYSQDRYTPVKLDTATIQESMRKNTKHTAPKKITEQSSTDIISKIMSRYKSLKESSPKSTKSKLRK